NFYIFTEKSNILTTHHNGFHIFVNTDNFLLFFLISGLLKFDKYTLKSFFALSFRKLLIFIINLQALKQINKLSVTLYFVFQLLEFILIFLINHKVSHLCRWYNSQQMKGKTEEVNGKFK
ncbi:hypothetical protein CDIK_4554, partial [Cucumispora dikerogammari]